MSQYIEGKCSIIITFFDLIKMTLTNALQDNNTEIVASKFGDRSSYAVVAAAENDEIVIGLPAKQGLVRQSPLTIVNNFQFLNEDLAADDLIEAKKQWFV